MRRLRHATSPMLWLLAAIGLPVLAAGPSAAGAADVAPSAEEIRPILVGASVPEVSVQTIDGEELDLAAAIRSKRTLLIFYRGGW